MVRYIDGALRPAVGPVSMVHACGMGEIKFDVRLPKFDDLCSDINVFFVSWSNVGSLAGCRATRTRPASRWLAMHGQALFTKIEYTLMYFTGRPTCFAVLELASYYSTETAPVTEPPVSPSRKWPAGALSLWAEWILRCKER